MILGGLPDIYKPRDIHITQNEDNVTFAHFKRRLRIYEEPKKMNTTETKDNVMKTDVKQERNAHKKYTSNQ